MPTLSAFRLPRFQAHRRSRFVFQMFSSEVQIHVSGAGKAFQDFYKIFIFFYKYLIVNNIKGSYFLKRGSIDIPKRNKSSASEYIYIQQPPSGKEKRQDGQYPKDLMEFVTQVRVG